VSQGRRQFVLDLAARIVDRIHPIGARIPRRGMGELQEVQENASHLAAHHVAKTSPQIFDLLHEILAVEAVVAGAQQAQHLGLVLRPGVEIILVARSVRHCRQSPTQPAAL
jgi:hypothetical protein